MCIALCSRTLIIAIAIGLASLIHAQSFDLVIANGRVIDPESGPAEVWTPDASFPVYETERLTWQPAGASAPFVVELAGLRAP